MGRDINMNYFGEILRNVYGSLVTFLESKIGVMCTLYSCTQADYYIVYQYQGSSLEVSEVSKFNPEFLITLCSN